MNSPRKAALGSGKQLHIICMCHSGAGTSQILAQELLKLIEKKTNLREKINISLGVISSFSSPKEVPLRPYYDETGITRLSVAYLTHTKIDALKSPFVFVFPPTISKEAIDEFVSKHGIKEKTLQPRKTYSYTKYAEAILNALRKKYAL